MGSKLRSQEDSILDLETKIMAAWNIVSDTELVYYAMEDMSEDDDRLNALTGLISLGEARFQDLNRVFEQFVKRYYEEKK